MHTATYLFIMDGNVTERDCIIKSIELKCVRCAESKLQAQNKNNLTYTLDVMLIANLGEELPQHDAEGPDVDALGAWLVTDHFRGHPGYGAGEAHDRAHVVPLAGRAEIAHLHHQIIGNEDTVETQNILAIQKIQLFVLLTCVFFVSIELQLTRHFHMKAIPVPGWNSLSS